jgi:alanine-glyoxylate transaminase/serine-glyoxylate transaminase/serine-pyruvate transaminase
MDEVQQGLRYLFQTDSPYTLCASGTGHAGMEMVIANLLEPGEKIVVGNNGIWVRRPATRSLPVSSAQQPVAMLHPLWCGDRNLSASCLTADGDACWCLLQGSRVCDMAGRFAAEVVDLQTEAGTSFSLETLTAAVEQHKPAVLFLVQGESSTGVHQSLAG